LLLKDGENGIGRIARLELGDEGMCKEVVLRALLVCVQSVVDDQLEVGGLVVGRGRCRLGVRHEVCVNSIRKGEWEFVGDGAEGNGSLGATLPQLIVTQL
jgi:hypothetical protein